MLKSPASRVSRLIGHDTQGPSSVQGLRADLERGVNEPLGLGRVLFLHSIEGLSCKVL
jgi:hypothetical protein